MTLNCLLREKENTPRQQHPFRKTKRTKPKKKEKKVALFRVIACVVSTPRTPIPFLLFPQENNNKKKTKTKKKKRRASSPEEPSQQIMTYGATIQQNGEEVINSHGAMNSLAQTRSTTTPPVYDQENKKSQERQSKHISFAENSCWVVNFLLLGFKLYIFITTGSKAVLAALADSVVDLLSQVVLLAAQKYQDAPYTNDYPVGRARMEALSVLACGVIMSFASVEVIQYSCMDLYRGFFMDIIPELTTKWYVYAMLGSGTVMKLVLWKYCGWVETTFNSDMVGALAEDSVNDVLSNLMALITLAIAAEAPNAWWVDPVGAIAISLVIIYRWVWVAQEQVHKIVGRTAPDEFILQVEEIARTHDDRVLVDITRAYYCGARFYVEMEIVLPGEMTVFQSHDLALEIQHKIEALNEVERAFVHVDHQMRDGLEHKVERELVTIRGGVTPTRASALVSVEGLHQRSVSSSSTSSSTALV